MTSPVFYAPPNKCSETIIELPAPEAHHALNVMRMKQGQTVVVVDGLGMAYRGELTNLSPRDKKAEVSVISTFRNYGEPIVNLTLAAGLSTGFKFDTVVEKGTELGVKRFVPLLCEKSRVKVDDPKRAASKVTRLEKVAMSAIKQCRRSYRPDISAPTSFTKFLDETDPEACNLLFHPARDAHPLDHIEFTPAIRRVTILIGPESGFSRDETEAAISAGFRAVGLGQRILRTETAGPVVCALIMNSLGELR